MAGQSDAVKAWKYTCNDNTTFYRLRGKTAIIAQQTAGLAVKVGGAACSTEVPLPPRGFRPRRVYCHDAGGHTRSVIAFEATAPIVTQGETINIQYAGAETAFTSDGILLEERRPRGIVDQS